MSDDNLIGALWLLAWTIGTCGLFFITGAIMWAWERLDKKSHKHRSAFK